MAGSKSLTNTMMIDQFCAVFYEGDIVLALLENSNNSTLHRRKLDDFDATINRKSKSIEIIMTKYRTSFTTGGLFFQEAIKIADLYLKNHDWNSVTEIAKTENILQARTGKSIARTSHEVIQRVQSLTGEQLELLVEGNLSDQKQILWLAVCKHYTLIREFAVSVIREKLFRLNYQMEPNDWDSFFNSKAEWNDELDQLTTSTKEKLRQVVFRMMHEADILSKENSIQTTVLSPRVVNVIRNDEADFLTIFPSLEKY